MGHSHLHGSGHSHDHHHAPSNFNKAFALGVMFNTAFVIVEAVYGVIAHSLTLLADAGHNAGDVLALLLAWTASALSKRVPTAQRTYGYRRSSILAALFNALFLLFSVGAIAWEAFRRFSHPAPVTGQTVIWVAMAGIVINGATALLFMSGRKGDINVRGAFLHMASDAIVSLGVVIAGFVILNTNWLWLDPAVSLLIVAVIFIGTWGLLKDSINMALDGVPNEIDVAAVKAYLAGLPAVTQVHDLHIWGMSTTETALTAHLVVNRLNDQDALLKKVCKELHDHFGIEHCTIQIENGSFACGLAPDEIV